MKTHNYPLRIQDEVWEDLKRIQQLDKQSANSLINEGVRMLCRQTTKDFSTTKIQELIRGNDCIMRILPTQKFGKICYS